MSDVPQPYHRASETHTVRPRWTWIGEQLNDVIKGTEDKFPGPDTRRSEHEVKRDIHRRWLRSR